MAFFGNKRKDFSIQPPRQQVDGTPFFVTDSANIDFTLENLNLTANLTQLLPISGTYGNATNIPVLQIDQWGRITGVTTIPIGGGGGTYTVNNGLSPQTTPTANANNFQLGGALIKNTIIDQGAYTLTFNQNTSASGIQITQTNQYEVALRADAREGVGIYGTATDGTGVYGLATGTGVGGKFQSASGYGLVSYCLSGVAAIHGFAQSDSYGANLQRQANGNVDLVTGVLKIRRNQASPASVPDLGYGASIDFFLGYKGAAGSETLASNISTLWTDPLLASKTSQFRIELFNDGNKQEVLNVLGTGQLQLNKYGQSTKAFPGTTQWFLAVNSSGDVIEVDAPTGTGNVTGSGTPNRVAFWTGTNAISDDSYFYWDNANKLLGLGLAGTRSGAMLLNALTSGNITLKATDTTTPYTLTLPNKPSAADLFLKTDASGNTSWATAGNTYTVENGLEAKSGSPNTFILGGALTKPTTITAAGSNTLTISSTNATPLAVSTTGSSQNALSLQSTTGAGLVVTSSDSVGIQSTSGQGNYAARLTVKHPTINNDILPVLLAYADPGTYPTTIGFGASFEFKLATTSSGVDGLSNRLISKWTNATHATRTSQFEITSVNNAGADTTTLTLKGTGQLQLNNYTGSTFDNAATKLLGVDSSGNVITTTGGGGGSTGDIYYLNGSVNQGTISGIVFQEMNKIPVIGGGFDYPPFNTDGYIASFVTDPLDPSKLLIPAGNWNFEMYFSANNSGGSPRFYIEVYKLSGSTLTWIASNIANPEFITNGNIIDLYITAVAMPVTPLSASDRIAIRVYVIHSSKIITLHTEGTHLCQVTTTFASSGGITELTGDVITPAASSGATAATLATPLKTGSFGITVDGVTTIVQVGQLGYVTIPYGGTITGWTITANAVGNIQFDIWKAAGVIPITSIITTGFPALTGTAFATSTSVGGWDTTFAAGDVFGFHITGTPTVIKNATLTIRCTKSAS